ncbi:hypothetical protein FQA39_LY17521 [Lamprigera yunnana]|nr:hypothetical protein FQA39_LY17521 [Lamprigera yunnana]
MKNFGGRENHLFASQVFAPCSGGQEEFYNSIRLKQEVFQIMRNDERSKVAINDLLICSYAESLLKKHKRVQICNSISNKMRELARLLMSLRNMTGAATLFEALKPEFFDHLVSSTKIISGYNPDSKTFTASSLALHMGTTLKQVCDIAIKMIIKKSKYLHFDHPEASLKSIKRLKCLVENHWTSEISSLALKNLNEQKCEKPELFPLSEDVMNFEKYSTKEELPQDVYQIAKVSKLVLAINKGKGNKYKGKHLDEIELSDEADSDEEQEVEAELFHTSNYKNQKETKQKSKGSATSTITSAPEIEYTVDNNNNICSGNIEIEINDPELLELINIEFSLPRSSQGEINEDLYFTLGSEENTNETNKKEILENICPVPKKVMNATKRKRAGKKSEVLTSTPFKEELAGKDAEKEAKENKAKNKVKKQIGRKSATKGETHGKISKKKVLVKKVENNVSGECPACTETYSDPPEVDLVQCSTCL